MEKTINLTPDPEQVFDIRLDLLTYGGDAMGRLEDGRAVFVPFGVPGDLVRVRLVEQKRGFARAILLDVLEPSAKRIPPRCRHFGECGGCHYQNLSYDEQLKAKTGILRDQLQRIGKIEKPPVGTMIACPKPWEYRNHIQFHLNEKGKLGYVNAAGDAILPVKECFLPEASINALWPLLEFEPNLPTGTPQTVERVSLRAGIEEDVMLILESETLEAPEMELQADISVVHLAEDDALVMAGEDHTFIKVLERTFKVSAASFFQVNTVMAEKMAAHVRDQLPISRSGIIIDIYCGVGLFSAFLADQCKRLIAIESSPSACEDFTANLDSFGNVELYQATAEAALPAVRRQIGKAPHERISVLVDPPRAGLSKYAVDEILQIQPADIAYVSCDPSTLARDAAKLIAAGYSLIEVTPFDLFPQTYHIETISLFKKK